MHASRTVPLLILIASTALVGGALLFQYVGGLQPCELCLYQRWPHYIVIVLSALALAAGRRRITAVVTAIAALAFLVGAGLAVYHVGVEQHWFAGPGACTGVSAAAGSIEDFRARLMAQQPVRCDEPQWALFGVSLAGWNLLASVALVIFCLFALRSRALRRRPA
ncbi:MAG TPA: disulfide bond formation protein B [Stellaceae bacterium]